MFANDEEEEDTQIKKIKIPKYKILHIDLEGNKKDIPGIFNTDEKLNTNSNLGDKKDLVKVSLADKILECMIYLNLILFFYFLDATTSLDEVSSDREIATKLKRKLDEDADFNNPSVSNVESKNNYLT